MNNIEDSLGKDCLTFYADFGPRHRTPCRISRADPTGFISIVTSQESNLMYVPNSPYSSFFSNQYQFPKKLCISCPKPDNLAESYTYCAIAISKTPNPNGEKIIGFIFWSIILFASSLISISCKL